MIDINYIKITQFDTANGPGIRTTLWVAGCEHECPGCHNESTWDPDQGHEFTRDTIDTILDSLSSKHIAGLTISGGDPLYYFNRSDVKDLVLQVKAKYPDKSIWLYTGYTYESLLFYVWRGCDYLSDILDNIDVLVDGPFISSKKDLTLLYRGSSNQRLIDMKRTLNSKDSNIYLYGEE